MLFSTQVSRKFVLAFVALAAALVLQALPMNAVTPAAYARCPLKGVAEGALAGDGYWAYVYDSESGQPIAVVKDEEKKEPRRFRSEEEAQEIADRLAAFLCAKLSGGKLDPDFGDPPPFYPLPIPPGV